MTAVKKKTVARGFAVAGVIAAAALATSACSAGQISQTANQVAAVNGNQANAGEIALRNVRIDYPLSPGAVNPTPDTNKKGGHATLLFSAINNSPTQMDSITSITTNVGSVTISRPAGDDSDHPQLQPQQTLVAGRGTSEAPVQDGAPGADGDNQPITVTINNLTRDLTPGLPVPVTFNFVHNGSVTVDAQVDPARAPRLVGPKSPGDTNPTADK